MALPYSLDDAMPAGAIRSALRSPFSEMTPMAIPASRQQSFAPPPLNYTPMPETQAPQFDLTQPQPGVGDVISSALNSVGKLMQPKRDDSWADALDKALADLKAQSFNLYNKLNTPSQSGGSTADTYLNGARAIESGGDDNAVNSLTGASGRYQFLPSTAKALAEEHPELGLDIGKLNDPDTQEKLMKLYTDKSVKTLEPILGRKPKAAELYLLHLLGHAGGSSVIRNLDAPITDTIPRNAREANKALLGGSKTGRQLLADLNKRFGD